MTVQQMFSDLRDGLNASMYERRDEVDISLNALLTRQHVVFIGPPGTAKSMMADAITNSIEGATQFTYLFNKYTTPEEIFGPFDVAALKNGEYKRLTRGKLPEAHIAFMDEVFKANSAILNACLTIMNERLFDNGTSRNPVPLMSVFAASNELPEGDELWALYDRFQYRKRVDYLNEPTNFISMLTSPDEANVPSMTAGQLLEAQNAVMQVNIPDGVYETVHAIREDLHMEGVIASDRRFKQTTKALRASAWLDGRDVVTDNDFGIMTHMLWTHPNESKTVTRVVLTHTNPLELEAEEIIDQVEEIAGKLAAALLDAKNKSVDATETLTKQGIEWFAKCRALSTEVKKLEEKAKKQGRPTNKIEQAKNRVLRVAKSVGEHTIGFDTD